MFQTGHSMCKGPKTEESLALQLKENQVAEGVTAILEIT